MGSEDSYFPPLDEKSWDLFQLDDGSEDLDFLKSQTGIQDGEELKKHVTEVQKKAYEIYGYPCIRSFSFARSRVTRLPAYSQIKPLLRKHPDAIMLDLGCCFGTDLRKVALDGFPMQNLIGSDVQKAFWDYGHELFRSTPRTFPVAFLAGDIFDTQFFAPAEIQATESSSASPPLSTLESLTALNGHVSVLHVSYLFHLFSEQKQMDLARMLAGMLSPRSGSVMFGAHIGKEVKGFKPRPFRGGQVGHQLFCHSPQSWKEMLENIFVPGVVKVEAVLLKRGECHPADLLLQTAEGDEGVMMWSCTRL